MTDSSLITRRTLGALMLGTVAACGPRVPVSNPTLAELPPPPTFDDGYGPLFDAGFDLPGIPSGFTQGINRRMEGEYLGEAPENSIDVDPYAKFLYHVKRDGTAVRYPVGVGRAGRSFSGNGIIRVKKKWPGWTPTQNMLRTEPDVYGDFRKGIPGGMLSPLGARALYLYRNGRDTFFRIHGTNDWESIGNSGSAGCIRMFNQDIIHLYDEVELDVKVHVRSEAESLRVDPENFDRGIELPARHLDPELVYGENANKQKPDFDAVDPNAPIEEILSEI